MNRKHRIALSLACATILPTVHVYAQERVDICGRLVQGAECLLFEADGGGRFVLDNVGTFDPGDRVRVTGDLDPSCATTCLEGDGCIQNNTIGACTSEFVACGTLVQGVQCVLFETADGSRYLLENEGNFGPGDRVRVSGDLDPECFTVCLEGEGCIQNNTITDASDDCVPPRRDIDLPVCGFGSLGMVSLTLATLAAARMRRL